jgi:hypothetical protein
MVVILNNTDVVYLGHLCSDNLILMDKYHYFASTCHAFGYDIRPTW